MRSNSEASQAMVDSVRAEGCLCCRDTAQTYVDLDERERVNLEFHHVDPSTKRFTISGSRKRLPLAKVAAELAKCVVLCTICHKAVHAGQKRIERDVPDDDRTPWVCRNGAGGYCQHHGGY